VRAEQEAGRERDRAELLAAEAALEKGQSKLEAGDSWGLFDLVEAYGLAENNPTFQETIGRRWSTWHAEWERRTIAVRRTGGIPSPDHLLSATLQDWPPNNTEPVVNLIDTLTGKPIAGPLVHESIVKGGAFSPDGRLFATVTEKGVIHLWDCRTGVPVRPPCETGVPELNHVSFSPDGRSLAAFSFGNGSPQTTQVAILRLDEAQGTARPLPHRYLVHNAKFSPDGEFLAVMGKPDLQLWRTGDFQKAGPPIPVNLSGLIEFSADGTRLAFGPQSSGELGLLNPRTQQIVQNFPMASEYGANSCSFSHDGRLLATFDWDGNLSLWRPTDSTSEPYATQKMGARISRRLSFNRDDSLLAVGDVAGTIHVLSAGDGGTIRILHAFPKEVAPHFLSNGVLAARGDHSGFWDLSASPLPESTLSHDALAYSLAFDRSGAFLAVGGEGELRLWRMEAPPRLEHVVSMPGRVLALTFSEAEDQFVAFSDDGSLTRMAPRTGTTEVILPIDRGYELSARLAPDGRRLALFRYNEAFVVDAQTGAFQQLDFAGGHRSVAFRRDSQEMAVGVANWTARFYDMSAASPAFLGSSDKLGGWVEGVAYHPGGRMLAVCVEGDTIRLYDPNTSRQIFGTYEPSLAGVDLLCFSPDGSLLATAGPRPDGGHGIEIWHVDPERGLYRGASVLPCEQPVWSLAFSPDSRTLVTAGLGATRLWHLPPAPKDLEEVQSRTWATLGFRLDEKGNMDFLDAPTHDVEEIRARLTQPPSSSVTPLDSALTLPPAAALTALQALGDEHREETVYKKLQGHLHAGLVAPSAMQGRWEEALAHANEAIRLDGADPHTRFQHARLLLQAGDVEGYRASCQSTMERYKSCNDPAVIKWVVAAVAARAGTLDDYTELVEHVRRSASLAGGADGPAFRFYLGVVLVRAGRYAEAATELEQMDRHLDAAGAKVNFFPIYYEFLLAICHAHLGHQDAARKWFDVATEDTQQLFRTDQGASSIFWTDRHILPLLQQEAEAALSTLSPVPERSR
jgi:WD40 repeat protein/tetratricopeptide (TPR) repeat protein